MDDMNHSGNEKENKIDAADLNQTESGDLKENGNGNGQEFDFMKERIKERPLNKKKLLRRTIITASMAAVFGLVACLTFLLLEPVFSNWLYPEEAAENITFPPETEEMLPEDMAFDDEELEQSTKESEEEEEEIIPGEGKEDKELENFQILHEEMKNLTMEAAKALVTVTGVTSDTDWFDNIYESTGQTTGLIVANNGREYLILVNKKPVETVETILVTFCDNTQVQAVIKKADPITGLAVLAVEAKGISEKTAGEIAIAMLGSSNQSSLVGSPVAAIGSPVGSSGSVVYGTITSAGNLLDTVDSSYKLITTDIYGSPDGTGVLLNMRGKVIGIINQNYNNDNMKNLISALGISELKNTIERLSNGRSQAYLGVRGVNVPAEANAGLKVPYGAYVTGIELDSPAMQAGIQSGDVIVQFGNTAIETYGEYIGALSSASPGSTVNITVMRQNQDEYQPMRVDVTLAESE